MLNFIEYSYFDYKVYIKNVDSLNLFSIFHQNISGLRTESSELIKTFDTDDINPQ